MFILYKWFLADNSCSSNANYYGMQYHGQHHQYISGSYDNYSNSSLQFPPINNIYCHSRNINQLNGNMPQVEVRGRDAPIQGYNDYNGLNPPNASFNQRFSYKWIVVTFIVNELIVWSKWILNVNFYSMKLFKHFLRYFVNFLSFVFVWI